MIKIPATDYEGRYLEPFLSFIVLHKDTPIMGDNSMSAILRNEWGAEFVDGEFPGSAAYVEFKDPEMATAFSLRWNHAALQEVAIPDAALHGVLAEARKCA